MILNDWIIFDDEWLVHIRTIDKLDVCMVQWIFITKTRINDMNKYTLFARLTFLHLCFQGSSCRKWHLFLRFLSGRHVAAKNR